MSGLFQKHITLGLVLFLLTISQETCEAKPVYSGRSSFMTIRPYRNQYNADLAGVNPLNKFMNQEDQNGKTMRIVCKITTPCMFDMTFNPGFRIARSKKKSLPAASFSNHRSHFLSPFVTYMTNIKFVNFGFRLKFK